MHVCHVPIRWSDFDRNGHLNNNAYIELAQEARLQFALDEFVPNGFEIPVVFVRRLTADFNAPIMPDTNQAEVRTWVNRVGRTSFDTRQEICDHNGKVCCTIDVVQIWMDVATAKPKAITAAEVKVLTQGEPLPEGPEGS
ncbi:MAG: acyl-CoA thioesterase [Corynebacterium sp.]|nr:acyl-CoA thioesterase [Corynebacterium sp.]